jgi:hypothetical protein
MLRIINELADEKNEVVVFMLVIALTQLRNAI